MTATTVVYAQDSVSGSSSDKGASSSTAGVITGWCDIVYNENGVVVTLTPDKEEILGITKSELRAILQVVIDAAKKLVVEDIKNQILGSLTPDFENSENASGVTVDNLWTMAINGYIGQNPEKYPGGAVDFLKAAVNDESETVIGDFIDFACRLIESALASGVVTPEQLPAPEDIENKITEVFDQKVNEFIADELPKYTEEYLVWLETGKECSNKEIQDIITAELEVYIKNAVTDYVDNGFKATPGDAVSESISLYLDKEIKNKVDEYIRDFANGELGSDENGQKVNAFIQEYFNDCITEILENWPNKVDNPISDVAHDKIQDAIIDKINAEIDAYFEGTLNNATIKSEIEAQIKAYAPDYLPDIYWNYRDAANKPEWVKTIDAALADTIKSEIEKEIREEVETNKNDYINDNLPAIKEEVKGKILDELKVDFKNEHPELNEYQFNEKFDEYVNSTEGILKFDEEFNEYLASDDGQAKLNEKIEKKISEKIDEEYNRIINDTDSIKSEIEKNDDIKKEFEKKVSDTIEDADITIWGEIWNELGNKKQLEIEETVIANIAKTQTVKDIILDYCDTKFLQDAASEIIADSDKYANILDKLISEAKKDAEVKVLLEQEMNEKIKDTASVISTLRTAISDIKADDVDSYESLMSTISSKVSEEAKKPKTIEKAYQAYFGLNSEQVDAKVDRFSELLIIDYTVLYNKAQSGEQAPELTPEALLSYLSYVAIVENGQRYKLYTGGELAPTALYGLLSNLPTIDDLAVMPDEEMKIDWTVEIATIFGVCDFDVVVALGSSHEHVRNLCSFITKYVDISIGFGTFDLAVTTGKGEGELSLNPGGLDVSVSAGRGDADLSVDKDEFDASVSIGSSNADIYIYKGDIDLNVDIKVPAKFAELLVRAAQSGRVPEALKQKVFAAISASPDDAYALFNALTFEEIITLIEKVPFEKFLDSKYVSRFEKLDGLTEEQILDKVREYEYYYRRLCDYIVAAYEIYFPDRIKDNSVIDLYDGNGQFAVDGEYTLDAKKVLLTLNEKYGAIIADLMPKTKFDICADLSVTFEDINRVEFNVNGKTVREGLLPAGADLKFFSGIGYVNGYVIDAWKDVETGKVYTKMPDFDVVLEPVYTRPVAFIVDGEGAVVENFTKVYDGESSELYVSVDFEFNAPSFSYQWYKDGVAIPGATSEFISVKNVSDSGEYYCIVSVKDGAINDSYESTHAQVNITPMVIPGLENIEWDYTGPYAYNGQDYTVKVNLDTLPQFVTVDENSYVDNVKRVAGKYTAKVTLNVTSNNYKLPDDFEALTLDWEITTAFLYLADLEWAFDEGVSFEYNGEIQEVYIKNVGNVIFTYVANKAINTGKYTAEVVEVVNNDENYLGVVGTVEDIPKLNWEITPKPFDLSSFEWDYEGGFVYDGETEHKVLLKDLGIFEEYVVYENNTSILAGNFEAEASFNEEFYETQIAKNYDFGSSKFKTLSWSVAQAEYKPTYAGWNASSFEYSEGEHEVYLVDANGDRVADENLVYSGNKETEVGSYTATVTLNAEMQKNYYMAPITHEWSIEKRVIDISSLTWDYFDGKFTYNYGEEFTVALVDIGDLSFTYTGNKGSDAKTYTAVATLAEKFNDTSKYTIKDGVNTLSLTWEIKKLTVAVGELSWKLEGGAVYNGLAHKVYLVDANGEAVKGVTYTNNEFIDAGTYTASVKFDNENCIYQGQFTTEYVWTIEKAVFDLSGITFEDKTVNYDGNAHSIAIGGLDAFLLKYAGTTYELVPPSATDVGVYTIKLTFHNKNYQDASLSAILTILSASTTEKVFEIKSESGVVIIRVTGKNGLSNDFEIVFLDKTPEYKNTVVTEGIFEGLDASVRAAYDIHFMLAGVQQAVTDEFTVEFLIPESLRQIKDKLAVVHIANDGTIENMNAHLVGDYLMFDTTHFSVYAIVELSESTEPGPGPGPGGDDEGGFPWLLLIAILLIVIALVIVLFVVLRKNKPTDDSTDAADVVPVDEPSGEELVSDEATEEPAEEHADEPVQEAEEESALESTEEAVSEETVTEPIPAVVIPVEPANEPTAEANEPTVEEAREPEIKPEIIISGDVEIPVRYRHSFMSRLIQSEPPIQDYYTEVKNALMSYKGVKARTSWNFESFNKGRDQLAKLNVKGKNFLVYLNLNPEEYNVKKYHFQDVTGKPKVGDVPMLLKVKSDRGLKYAIELIYEMMAKFEFERSADAPIVDYHMPFETTEELAKRDLVKVILPAGVKIDENANIVKIDVGELLDAEKKADGKIVAVVTEETEITSGDETVAVSEAPAVEHPAPIDVQHADELVSDSEAEASILIVERDAKDVSKTNKMGEINIDTISENFNDGDVVTLKELKAKKLVSSSIGRIKVLARGSLDKKLTVIADKFSLQAVKMITLEGGVAEQYKK
jgi:hypothetical protein